MSFEPVDVLKAVRRLSKTDAVLGEVIRDVGPFTLKPDSGGYGILVRSILSQQISTSADYGIRRSISFNSCSRLTVSDSCRSRLSGSPVQQQLRND